jgi:hypothetical protein
MLIENKLFKSDCSEPPTPTHVQNIYYIRSSILKDLPSAYISPNLAIRIRKYVKGATVKLDLGAQIEKDLHHIQAAEKARKTRKQGSQRLFKGGGYSLLKRLVSVSNSELLWSRVCLRPVTKGCSNATGRPCLANLIELQQRPVPGLGSILCRRRMALNFDLAGAQNRQ